MSLFRAVPVLREILDPPLWSVLLTLGIGRSKGVPEMFAPYGFNFFIFMQFLRKTWSNNRLVAPL